MPTVSAVQSALPLITTISNNNNMALENINQY